jgi:hypothetical protein
MQYDDRVPRFRARLSRILRAGAALAAGAAVSMGASRLFADDPAPFARDESFVVRFARPASLSEFLNNSYFVTRNEAGVEMAQGRFVSGRPLLDPATNRQVVVRPEALREYFALVRGLPFDEAEEEAARVLARVERTGSLTQLYAIDEGLKLMFGETAGTRLDDPQVTAFCPPFGVTDEAPRSLRRLIAGDDEKWHAYFVNGDLNAWSELTDGPPGERFVHTIFPDSGTPHPGSLLREREHRRVLMRRTRSAVTFLPDIPMRAVLNDAGYAAGAEYELTVSKRFKGGARELLTESGGVVPFLRRVAKFRASDDTFLGGAPAATTTGTPEAPRIVGVTPPPGETNVDRTTDWEDPDSQFLVPVPARKLFVIRLRFSRPLDPRTVDDAHFTLTKTATFDAVGNPTPVTAAPSAISVWLSQRRMGEVVVEITPWTNLDPMSRYRLDVLGTVKGLDGTPLGDSFSYDL